MKAIQTLKQLWPFHHETREKVAPQSKVGFWQGRVGEYALGTFCFLMFIALGPFAAIPAFFTTFSIPKWLEEQKETREGAN
ncbi:MAG: hypothetical protein GXO20_02495 [Thermodesulfobacteria bacterium]|nr:hypothetical protein [Thermodesulfobacteriota bacterium]